MLVQIVLVVVAAGVLCVAYGALIERRWYRLIRHRVDILPAEGPERLSVLHLSDLHYLVGDGKMRAFLEGLPSTDVTVITGDIIGEPEAVEESVAALHPFRGRLASIVVLGSNDYYEPRPVNPFRYFFKNRRRRLTPRSRAPELVERLRADGWVHLRNERTVAELDGLPLELLGLDDAHIGWHDLRVAPRRAPERFGLAVMHSPDAAPELAALGYDLIVAGHTHGGQVRMPIAGALVTNCQLPRRLASGLIRLEPAFLHISQGLGTSKFAPFRFLCRPEATVLELRRAAQPLAVTRSNTAS